jgi:hypothetical protein
MIDDERLQSFVRAAAAKAEEREPASDLWPRVRARMNAPAARPSWFDIGLAAIVVLMLLVFPEWISLLAYNL